MDKKQLLITDLTLVMEHYMTDIQTLVVKNPEAPKTQKADGSYVTDLDVALCKLFEKVAKKHFPDVTYYSEENFKLWKFPLMAVDPIDGTREYMAGRPEWSASIGIFQNSSFEGQGWVYNPMTKKIYDSRNLQSFEKKTSYQGEVSRSEWEQGLFKNISSTTFEVKPMGSIAYKLGRLSNGETDFVVSLRPKNIWDIAAGTILCKQAGLKFYSKGKEVTSVEKLYEHPLIWCHESLFSELSQLFS